MPSTSEAAGSEGISSASGWPGVATNALARALFVPLFTSRTADERCRPNFARYSFLDPGAHRFADDWDSAASTTVTLLRTEAGRCPHDKELRELIGELSTVSTEFRTRCAAHDVRIHHGPATGAGRHDSDGVTRDSSK
ncbi:MmyB family transcriptional regulator [Streptomyces sp. NPDC001709]